MRRRKTLQARLREIRVSVGFSFSDPWLFPFVVGAAIRNDMKGAWREDGVEKQEWFIFLISVQQE